MEGGIIQSISSDTDVKIIRLDADESPSIAELEPDTIHDSEKSLLEEANGDWGKELGKYEGEAVFINKDFDQIPGTLIRVLKNEKDKLDYATVKTEDGEEVVNVLQVELAD